jgi:hypothetical protein
MSMSTLFSLSSLLVMPFWALMILLPGWRWSERLIRSPRIAAPAALLYAALVVPQLGGVLGAVANPDLAGIAALFASEAAVTVAWVHFLAFDLFVGRWVYLDARERRIHPLVSGPVLLLVLLLGPLGFVVYLLLRSSATRRASAMTAAV